MASGFFQALLDEAVKDKEPSGRWKEWKKDKYGVKDKLIQGSKNPDASDAWIALNDE